MNKKNLRKIRCTVTSQTLYNLQHMAAAMGTSNVGMVIDKLTREKMLSNRIDMEKSKDMG